MNTTTTHIRTLFLHPKPTYTTGEATTLLEMDWRDLREWMETGDVEGVEADEELVVPWGELVSFAMELWSQEVVEEALGADVAEALPELLRLTALEVRIPRMQIVALERLAALDGETASAVLARELRDLVSVHSEWLSQEVPGFAEAFAWPETPLVASPRGRGAAGAPGAKPRRGETRRVAETIHRACTVAAATARPRAERRDAVPRVGFSPTARSLGS